MDSITKVYRGSGLAAKAGKYRLLSFMDVDGTTSSYNEDPTDQEIDARREIREILESQGGYVLTTARTPELCMSERILLNSRKVGFTRLDPKCCIDNGVRVYRPLSTIRKYAHLTDPDAIHSIGEGIWVKRGGAYHPDTGFYTRRQVQKETWKRGVRSLLSVVDHDFAIRGTFSELEDPDNHKNGRVDVQEVECRFELTAKPGTDGAAWKSFVRERLRGLLHTTHPLAQVARSIEFIDESNPAKGRYQYYLVPHRRLTKEGALNHMLHCVSLAAKVPTEEFTILSAGDRMPDLKAGLFSGFDAKGIFILAGGSVLTEYLVGGKRGQDFAGQSLRSIVQRLHPTNRKGWYRFYMYGMANPRVVVIADEAVPGGKTDAESVLGVLKQIKING